MKAIVYFLIVLFVLTFMGGCTFNSYRVQNYINEKDPSMYHGAEIETMDQSSERKDLL